MFNPWSNVAIIIFLCLKMTNDLHKSNKYENKMMIGNIENNITRKLFRILALKYLQS